MKTRPARSSARVDTFDDVPASTKAWIDAMVDVALERLMREREPDVRTEQPPLPRRRRRAQPPQR
jgi:hypothetical protein